MTRILGVLVIIVIIIGCIGLYFGWFSFGSENTSGTTHITVTVDKDKIKQDEDTFVKKVKNIGHNATETSSPEPVSKN